MTKNGLHKKLNLIASSTEGIFLSSALVSSKSESASWVKFQRSHPEMFKIIFSDRAKIVQGTAEFFCYFFVKKVPREFKTQEDIMTEILHSTYVLDMGQGINREGDLLSIGREKIALDNFSNVIPNETTVITIEEREGLFKGSVVTYVSKKLRNRWGKLCIQKYFMNGKEENCIKEKEHTEVPFKMTPEEIRAFLLDGVDRI